MPDDVTDESYMLSGESVVDYGAVTISPSEDSWRFRVDVGRNGIPCLKSKKQGGDTGSSFGAQRNEPTVDPLDLVQWRFFVISTER